MFIGDYHLSLAGLMIGVANFVLLVLILLDIKKGNKR